MPPSKEGEGALPELERERETEREKRSVFQGKKRLLVKPYRSGRSSVVLCAALKCAKYKTRKIGDLFCFC